VDEHDLHGGALLVVVGRERCLIDTDREGDQRRGGEPRQHAVDDAQEAGGVGEIDQGHWTCLSLFGIFQQIAIMCVDRGKMVAS